MLGLIVSLVFVLPFIVGLAGDLDFEVTSKDEGEKAVSGGGGSGRTSAYEPVAQKYKEIDKDSEAIKLSGLTNNDIQNLRNLLYRRFGKEEVIVRSSKVQSNPEGESDIYDAVVRQREGDEYLRNSDSPNGEVSDESEPTEAAMEDASDDEDVTDDELEDVF